MLDRWDQTTDEVFLDAVLPVGPKLAKAVDLAGRGKVDKAIAAVVAHFRSRRAPQHQAGDARKAGGAFAPSYTTYAHAATAADGRLAARNRLYDPHAPADPPDLGPDLDWSRVSIDRHGAPSRAAAARGLYASYLAAAYAGTRKSRFARSLVRWCSKWMADFPPAVTEDPVHSVYFNRPADARSFVGARILAWLEAFYSGVLSDAGAPDRFVFDLLKTIWFWGQQFGRLTGAPYQPGMHHLFNCGEVPWSLSVLSPEFRGFEAMRAPARDVLREHVERGVFADGGYEGHSTAYARHVLDTYTRVLTLARVNDLKLLKREHLDRLRMLLRGQVYLTDPSGRLAPFGLNPTEADASGLAGAAAVLGDDLAKHALQSGLVKPEFVLGSHQKRLYRKLRKGRRELTPSVMWRQAGYAILRQDWDGRAAVAMVGAGGQCLPGVTRHWDGGAVQLHVQGEQLLGDPATWLCRAASDDSRLKRYMASPLAHNILAAGPALSETADPGQAPIVDQTLWYYGRTGDHVELSHKAYAGLTVRRQVVLLREYGLLLTADVLTGDGAPPQRVQQLFHGHFGVTADARSDGTVRLKAGRARVQMAALAAGDASVHVERSPHLGPACDAFGLAPAPLVRVGWRVDRLPAYLPVVFAWRPDGSTCRLRTHRLTVSEKGEAVAPTTACAFRIQNGDDQFILYMSLAQPAQRCFLGRMTNKEFFLGILNAEGKVDTLIDHPE